ncbi:MAG: mannose-1-phosphate guanylyltransferase/mannose-6-phosphate isomerase [Gammaproteobacteria bacterium]|nr:mannose-1-phosphate guanylyltransferase/mannose-6-phosphate isomerase [Gammaproteobacteria bacterium]
MAVIVPVILSGGSGSRLWPLSRELYPKQLLSLTGNSQTMLQQTATRLDGMAELAVPMVICNARHRFLVAEQLLEQGIEGSRIYLEPMGRNTAPATAIAALELQASHGADALMLILPADHVIRDLGAFHQAVQAGARLAAAGELVTFGVVPSQPHTGYGYILKGDALDEAGYRVGRFVEKPDLDTAREYVNSGDYLWNSGMFLFRADRVIEEMQQHSPAILSACQAAFVSKREEHDFVWLDDEDFGKVPSDSIDYALMEKTTRAAVVPLDAGWDDVGSWSALWDMGKKDASGNVSIGDVQTVDVQNSYLHATNRMIAAVGISDHVIVETSDAVLVAHKDKVQDVKEIVSQLKTSGREEAHLHQKVFRPWGSYECLDEGDRFKVKHIIVRPGASLSLQMHRQRAEHWVVVSGVATVTCGDRTFDLNVDESTYIPVNTQHRLENRTDQPLSMIEVQSGDYVGEDDIIRLEDIYGREKEAVK